jgi:hypothetical protein
MLIQLFPENIRLFVGELTIGKPGVSAGPRNTVQFEFSNTPSPAETTRQGFLEYSRDAGKGVDIHPAIRLKPTDS